VDSDLEQTNLDLGEDTPNLDTESVGRIGAGPHHAGDGFADERIV